MAVKLLTPRLGEGVEEVTVLHWLKQVGDAVKELEPLVEVETDKVVTEIPSPAAGVLLEIQIQAGSVARVGQALGLIGAPGESLPAASATLAASAAVAEFPQPEGLVGQTAQAAQPAAGGAASWISPIVRKMAAEYGLDLSLIRGSGLGGRVTKQDVLDYLDRRAAAPTSVVAAAQGSAAPPTIAPEGDRLLPISSVRRQIAERMVHSVHSAPHVLTVMEADFSQVLAHQAANKDRYAAEGIRLTLTAYLISAIARALRDNPLVNASWTDQGIMLHAHVNIGMAVSLGDEGLIVPVLRDADQLSLRGIARMVNDLADRARAKKLHTEEVQGATFTLTNHGVGGSLFALPIINQPQVGILGAGALQKRAVVVSDSLGQDALAIRPMMYLSLVFDHRILDGASADKFLSAVKKFIESEWQ